MTETIGTAPGREAGPASEGGMSCGTGPGASHYACCAFHEAAWAEKLAAAEARIRGLEKALKEIGYKWEGFQWHSVCGTHVEADQRCAACIARAALTPPPEAAKRGEDE